MKNFSDSFVEGIIKRVIKGTISSRQASIKLGISKRYVNKLVQKYQELGVACFTHGNTGKQRTWKTDLALEQRIVSLYNDKYVGFNFTHFLEKLVEDENISITYGALYRILTQAGFKSPKRQHKKKKTDIHPLRPRKENFGEMLQIDASIHPWFGPNCPKATLHGAVDDSTGIVMGLYFDKEETLKGYYNMLKQILLKYGIPESLYSDNRTIFEFRKLSEKNKTIDRDVHIQFRRCCSQLGIEVITTSVAQAKGKIERLWGSLQSRLMSELSLHRITTIEDANAFLPAFTADYNKRFASKPDPNKSRFVTAPSEEEINYFLSILYYRKTDLGSSFKFLGKTLQLKDSNGKTVRIAPKKHLDVYLTLDKTVVAVCDGKYYETKEADITELQALKPAVEQTKDDKPKWKPESYHPWRRFVINSYKKGGNN